MFKINPYRPGAELMQRGLFLMGVSFAIAESNQKSSTTIREIQL